MLQKANDDHREKLSQMDGHVQGVVSQKEEDLDAYRNKVHELQLLLSESESKIEQVQDKNLELAQEIETKQYEIDFYLQQVNDMKEEMGKSSGGMQFNNSMNKTGQSMMGGGQSQTD